MFLGTGSGNNTIDMNQINQIYNENDFQMSFEILTKTVDILKQNDEISHYDDKVNEPAMIEEDDNN